MSDVQRIRQQIEDEAQVLRLLANSFKSASSHQIITASMDRIGKYQEKLKDLIGEDEANNAILIALGKDDEVVTSLEVTIPASTYRLVSRLWSLVIPLKSLLQKA